MVDEKKRSLKNLLFKPPVPFSDKRDLNWPFIRNVALGLVVLAVLVILVMPAQDLPVTFSSEDESSPSHPQVQHEPIAMPPSLRGYRTAMGYSGAPANSSTRNRSGAMVISREGLDPNSQLHPGQRIRVRLTERVVVSSQAMPVIGVVTEDFLQEGTLAIPKGSKVFGEVSFDSDSKRGQLSWRSIQIGSTRIRQFDALSTSLDGQAGIEGQVHSDALKNSIGQTMTKFIGAYAEGSMERTSMFGGSPGGSENGLKNAVSETAKDRAEKMAERMKKEREWLELKPDQEFFALLTQPFRFRDPGGTY